MSDKVGDRFVSSKAIEEAREKRAAEWQDAYARLGEEVPQELREQIEKGREGDGRSLFDQLRENRTKKQEAFEEKAKLKNQFRSLDDEEVTFLDRIIEEDTEGERRRRDEERAQLDAFREAVIKKQASAKPPPPIDEAAAPKPATAPKPAAKKKKTLPGVVVVKKKRPSESEGSGEPADKKAKKTSDAAA